MRIGRIRNAISRLILPKNHGKSSDTLRGFTSDWQWAETSYAVVKTRPNDLREFFSQHTEGHGLWKWEHYFDIYDRHLAKFRGRQIHLVEIGIYSGGSLDVWRDYFGPRAHIYGVDIQPECKAYEDETVKVFIGDQADRSFWKEFRKSIPSIDVVIDDGGHEPEQQIITLEELCPYISPGGIYICEDVHGTLNPFASYVHGVAHKLNDFSNSRSEDTGGLVVPSTPFQAWTNSVHLYPFVTVIERNDAPLHELTAPKHGTQWRPFYDEQGQLKRERG